MHVMEICESICHLVGHAFIRYLIRDTFCGDHLQIFGSARRWEPSLHGFWSLGNVMLFLLIQSKDWNEVI